MTGQLFENDPTVDISKVDIIDGHPHCKEHGAMNCHNGIWRCYSMYSGNPSGHSPKGTKEPKPFIDRTCNAAMKQREQRG